MRKEKVLKNRKKTEEEDEFNGLGRKKDGRKKKQIQEAKKKALSDHRWHFHKGRTIVPDHRIGRVFFIDPAKAVKAVLVN